MSKNKKNHNFRPATEAVIAPEQTNILKSKVPTEAPLTVTDQFDGLIVMTVHKDNLHCITPNGEAVNVTGITFEELAEFQKGDLLSARRINLGRSKAVPWVFVPGSRKPNPIPAPPAWMSKFEMPYKQLTWTQLALEYQKAGGDLEDLTNLDAEMLPIIFEDAGYVLTGTRRTKDAGLLFLCVDKELFEEVEEEVEVEAETEI